MFNKITTMARRFWMASIRRQLILGIALVHAVLMTFFVVDLVERQRHFLHEQSIAQAEGLAKTLASSSSSWVLANDLAGLGEVLQSQESFPELRYAMVVSPRGKVIVHTDRSKNNLYLTDAVSRSLLNAAAESQTLFANKHLVDVAYPILVDDDLIGWARVGIGQEKIAAGLFAITRNGAMYTLLAIFFGSVFAYFMSKSLIGGLRHLVSVAEGNRLGQRDLRVVVHREDEIGLLGRDFNLMLDALIDQEKNLRDREENLAVTLNSIGDAVITTDTDGNVLNMNPVAEQLTGWPLIEAQQQPLEKIFHIINSESRALVQNPVKRVLESGNIVGLANHTLLIARHGEQYQIADSAAPIRNKLGQITGVILVFHDVTEQYHQQALVIAHEAELRKITDVLPAPVARLDLNGRYMFVSAAYERWFGKRPEEVIGRTQRESVGAEHYARVEPYFKRALAGERVLFELDVAAPDGNILYGLVTALPDYDSVGAVCGFFIITADITQRKQAEQQLHESRQQAQNYLNVAAVMFLSLDTQGVVTLINHKGCEMMGLPEQDILGKNWFDHFLPHRLVADLKGVFARIITGDIVGLEYYENLVLTGREEERFFAWNNTLLRDETGQITGILSSAEDITERKQIEQNAKTLRDQFVQATKMEAVGHLTAGIAHDFNNILGAILGYAELSKYAVDSSTNVPANVDRYLGEILKSCNRAKELVAQMLTFSRLSPDLDSAEVPVTLLDPVAQEVVTLLRSSIASTIELKYQLVTPDLKARIQPIHLHQIILNLSINARDAMGEYGKLDIVLGKQNIVRQICTSCQDYVAGEFVKLTVRDSGSGIPEDILKNIFDPFFTTKDVGKGTGMGLSVVHGLVHSLGGHIAVESKPGKGTEINVFLPLEASAASSDLDVVIADTKQDDIEGIRIMVVDDESSLAAMMHEFLSMYGARVTSFDSPLQAWLAFEQHPEAVDIVITDETMPGLSGMHLAQRMLLIKPGLPVILCSGYSEHVTAELAEEQGLAGFFFKPIQMKLLLKKLHSIFKAINKLE